MAFSMTGFGRGEFSNDRFRVRVEIRSVNHRYLDLSIRLPRAYQAAEERFRTLVSEKISRGKVDAFLSIEPAPDAPRRVELDSGLADAYIEALDTLKKRHGIEGSITLDIVTRFGDIISPSDTGEDIDAVWEAVMPAAQQALDNLMEMRRREGAALTHDIAMRLDTIAKVAEEMAARAPLVVEAYRTRLEKRVVELLGDIPVDPARLATEVALFADRSNINEELTRLGSHVSQSRGLLGRAEPVGRRYDFLVQEMNREVNTIGSKANDLELARLVIDAKSELEKIREQIQNLE